MSKPQLKAVNKWMIAGTLMIVASLGAHVLLRFDIKVVLGITFIEGLLLLGLGERFVEKQEKRTLSYPHFILSILTISVLVVVIYLFGQASYITEEGYSDWFMHLRTTSSKSIEYEMGTLILSYYLIMIGTYHKEIWASIEDDICRCLPSSWCILLGIGLMIYSREESNYVNHTVGLFAGGGLMIVYLAYKTFISKEQGVAYHISPRRYLVGFIGCLLGIGVIGIYLPECQELPGTRWIRMVANSIGAKPNLYQKIPYVTRLNSDIPISDAVLFEVNATEPLYLREIAYSEYLDGVWRVSGAEESYDLYIDFKPRYLNAEYVQLNALLDEIAFQNSQDPSIFPEYARIASYETSIVRKKTYKILQNPINKINYFTVNSFIDIQDEAAKSTYYYQNLNNCYFHSENIIEPTHYKVTYYDRVPKIGSREYVFLRSINGKTWENIYKRVVENRSKYESYNEKLPKILLTYTPLVQYQNAKEYFLQVPEELIKELSDFTKQLTITQKSDWGRVELICNFLKNNYSYHLQNKKVEGDRVLHFLFEEKEGICQDFATSMTLMCRSIGIPAKYVTGYYASEKNKETGNYIIREKDAHAFVEVYIAGYGWMSFDPTPDRYIEEIKEEKTLDLSSQINIKLMMIGGGILILILLFRSKFSCFKEVWWLIIFRFTNKQRQLEKLMIRQEIWLEKAGFPRYSHETLSQYMQRLKQFDIDITISVKLYEKQKYGALQPNKSEIQAAYEAYKTLKSVLKRLK